MSRVFDDNNSNYMSRASATLGLNGSTECSFACWIKITGTLAGDSAIIQKQIGAGSEWGTISLYILASGTVVQASVQNRTSGIWPTWDTNAGIGTGVWTRVLFTWKRNAIGAADGVMYINGIAVAVTYTANGYTAGFTQEEDSNTLFYGQAPPLTRKLNASLAWVCIWNRQLTAQEALIDYTNPRNVKSGLLSIVELSPDTDQGSIGGSMTVNGTLQAGGNPPLKIGSFRDSLRQSFNWE